MSELTLSKHDIAKIHVMLSTMPIPPIPLTIVSIDSSRQNDGDIKNAFQMAMLQVCKDSESDDKIVNSHTIFASLSFFNKWTLHFMNEYDMTKMKHKKEEVIMKLIKLVLETKNENEDVDENTVIDLFHSIVEMWIQSCIIHKNFIIKIEKYTNYEKIQKEHPLHIAMSHYCYSQGVLYSNKQSEVRCTVHDSLQADYLEHKKNNIEEQQEFEHTEIAEMYSKFTYSKLLMLCFKRILNDALHGHNYKELDNVYDNANELLEISMKNYEQCIAASTESTANVDINDIAHNISEIELGENVCKPTVDTCVTKNTPSIVEVTPPCIRTDIISSKIESQNVDADIEVIVVRNNLIEIDNTTNSNIHDSDNSDTCDNIDTCDVKQIILTNEIEYGNYKSALGIFIGEMVSFQKKSNVYYLQNMCTCMRHLYEMLQSSDPHTIVSCKIIDIEKMFTIVRAELTEVNQDDTFKIEMNNIMIDIEEFLIIQT